MAVALVAMVAASNTAALPPVGEKDNGFSKADERYLHTYVDCWHAFKAECGRNIVDDGLSSGKAPSGGRVENSTQTMDRWLHPPAQEPTTVTASSPSPVSAPVTSVAPTTDSGGYSIPSYIVQCESGGSYSAQNASGAYGAYQIMPETASSYGCDLSTASGQDQCAAEIYADVGSSAWSCG